MQEYLQRKSGNDSVKDHSDSSDSNDDFQATIMAAEITGTPAILNPNPTAAGTEIVQTMRISMMMVMVAAMMMLAILSMAAMQWRRR